MLKDLGCFYIVVSFEREKFLLRKDRKRVLLLKYSYKNLCRLWKRRKIFGKVFGFLLRLMNIYGI